MATNKDNNGQRKQDMAKLKKTLPKEFSELCSKMIWSPEDIEAGQQLLSACEPDATERGGYKETALHMLFIPIEIVKWQVERGADVNAPNTYGTPLFVHAGRGNYEICRYLIENGADVSAEDYEGKTPLFNAADKGHADIVRLLLESGADPLHRSGKNHNYMTALIYMIDRMAPGSEGKAEVAGILIEAMGGMDKIHTQDLSWIRDRIKKKGEDLEFMKSAMSDEYREKTQAEMDKFYKLFDVEAPKPIVKHDGVSPIIVDNSLTIGELHDALWEYLVPPRGKCATVQGEVIRISGRIGDEVYRNGGINWDADYRRMLASLEEYLSMGTALGSSDMEKVKNASLLINKCKGCGCEDDVEVLQVLAVSWVCQNSNPIPLGDVPYKR